MAFDQKEQEIIQWGMQNGKTKAEVQQAIIKYRSGTVPESEPEPVVQEPSYGTQVADAAKAGVDKILSTQSDDTNIIRSAERGLKAARGIVDVATSPLAPLFSPLGKLMGYVTDKISETPLFKEVGELEARGHINEENAPEVSTIRRVAENVENLSVVAGTVGGVKGFGAGVSATTKALSKGNEYLEGISLTGTEGIRTATTRALNPASIMQRVARIPKQKQAAFEKMTGESVGQYLVNRGIFGNVDKLTEQLYKRFDTSKTAVDTAMAKLPGEYKSTAVGNALKQLADRERRVSSPGALSPDLERVNALQKKHNGAGLNMSEVNEVKRLYERNVRLDYVKENLTDKVALANNVDSAIRKWQFSQAEQLGFKNLAQLNKETQAAKQLLDDLGKEYAGGAANNAITLTDWIVLAGGDPTAAGAFLTKKALSSKTVMSKVAETLAPAPTKGTPKAELGAPTLDNYLKFLAATGGRTTPQ